MLVGNFVSGEVELRVSLDLSLFYILQINLISFKY